MLSIRVGATWNGGRPTGGRWLHGLSAYGDLALASTLRRPSDSDGGGGLLTASWSMPTANGVSLPAQVRYGSLVEIKAGPLTVGMGVVAETPNGDSVTVDGLFRLGEKRYAVDASGLPTTDVSVAVAQAITRGLRWRDDGTLPTGSIAALSEEQVNYNTVSALLNKYCTLMGKIWWIDRRGYLRIGDYPTTPRWLLSPSLPSMESADDDYASTYFVRRVDGVDTDGQPNAWDGAPAVDPTVDSTVAVEAAFDLEQLGYITGAAASAYAQDILAANAYRTGFTEGLSVIRGQLMTLGGVSPETWQVICGDPTMVRSPNWVSSSSRVQVGRRRDWVLGGAQWKQGEALTVVPFGLAPRTVASIGQNSAGRSELVFK